MRYSYERRELIDKYDLVEMLKNEYFEPLFHHICIIRRKMPQSERNHLNIIL